MQTRAGKAWTRAERTELVERIVGEEGVWESACEKRFQGRAQPREVLRREQVRDNGSEDELP